MHPLHIRTFLSFAIIGGVTVYLTVTKNGMKLCKRWDNPPREIKSDEECDEPGAGPSNEDCDEEHGAGPDEEHGAGPDEEHGAGPDEEHGAGRDEEHGAGPDEEHGAGPDEEPSAGPCNEDCDEEHGAGPSDQCKKLSLEPEHKIFLSHSGAQKDFTWQLCEDLENVQHYPFFDRRDDSLPKGEKFPPLILKAARQCRVAVLVISHEFFMLTKWPMIELNEFVKAQESSNQDLKTFPLFLGLTMKEFNDKERQACWIEKWKEFALCDERVNVEEWKASLSSIPGGINSLEYGGVHEGEVMFRKKVVKAICRLLPPDLKYNMSHVQSLGWLCEPIKKKLMEVQDSTLFNVKVVGMYGMGGVGKTTITMAMCNEMFKEFGGKVCHVELGDVKHLVELQKRVLRECTSINAARMSKCDPKMLDELLKQYMHRQEVFLVLDNVWYDDVDDVLKYLKVGHHTKSMVLVTSRSIEVLGRLGIAECNCMEMTNLEEEGAKDVLLHYSGKSRESIADKNEWEIVDKYAMYCCFSRGQRETWQSHANKKFHPLALKALGSQLATFEIKDWDEKLKSLDKFNIWKDGKHSVFNILRVGFDLLQPEQRELFMDLALLWTPIGKYRNGFDLKWEWLCTLHGGREDELKENVNVLQRNGLLEKVHDITNLDYIMHDLYYEFAEAEAHAGPFEGRGILFSRGGTTTPEELVKYPPNGHYWPNLKRLIILGSHVNSLKRARLHHCKNVEVLILYDCRQLEEVDVTGMDLLRLVVFGGCDKLRILTGFEKLEYLVYFFHKQDRWIESSMECNVAFGSTELQEVCLEGIQALQRGFPLGLNSCSKLNEVTLKSWDNEYIPSDKLPLVDFGKYLSPSIRKLVVYDRHLGGSPICTMATFRNLQDLDFRGCSSLKDLTGLCKLVLLQKLNLSWTGISTIPDDVKELKHLQYLYMGHCSNLTSIVNIVHATALQTVGARHCSSLREVPHDFSSLQQLEVLDLEKCEEIFSLPLDYKRLAGDPERKSRSILKVVGCFGLIEPLVQKLRGSEVAGDAHCEGGCNCVSSESMRSWIAAKKHVDIAAYNLLQDVLSYGGVTKKSYYDTEKFWTFRRFYSRSNRSTSWEYLLEDDNAVVEVLIRALCEHDVRGSRRTNRLLEVVRETKRCRHSNLGESWWIVVATAPCTFKAVTEGAMMKPWRMTLLHHTISHILPDFLVQRDCIIDYEEKRNESDEWYLETWHYQAIVAVLHKCREKLDDAVEEGIDPERCHEGKGLVHTFLREPEAAKSGRLEDGSTLMVVMNDWRRSRKIFTSSSVH